MSCQLSDDVFVQQNQELGRLITEIRSLDDSDGDEKQRNAIAQRAEKLYEVFFHKITFYQELPHMLDKTLGLFVEDLVQIIKESSPNLNLKLHTACKFLHAVSKTRGYKAILKHLPHEVSDMTLVHQLLSQCKPNDAINWHTHYVLLRWLSILLLIPISLKRFDDTTGSTASITDSIYGFIKTYLTCPSPLLSEAAAFLAAKFLIRPETRDEYIDTFVSWCCLELSGIDQTTQNTNVKLCVLLALAYSFKIGKREHLIKFAPQILDTLENSGLEKSPHEKVVKNTIKLSQRVGLCFLKRKIAPWRYLRGRRYLRNEGAADDGVVSNEEKPSNLAGDESDLSEAEDYSEYLGGIVELLLNGLRHDSTNVRWSAAKGVGRIAERLPEEMAKEIISSLLELFSFGEKDFAWHGGCLALAELGRRGLILPAHLPEVFAVVKKALVYDELKGTYFAGAHVRDAACYLCWSFARAYDAKVMEPFVENLAANLLIVSLFDREIGCRRAAAAALQENVGRQGTFPHGIDLVTKIDYQEVGVIKNSFTELASFVADFEEYKYALIEHLLERKLNHWDIEIRVLAAKSLGLICLKTSPQFTFDSVIPSLMRLSEESVLNSRHGALIGFSELFGTLLKLDKAIPQELVSHISKITHLYVDKNVFRGAGGDFMKDGFCSLVSSSAKSKLSFDDQTLVLWSQILLDSIYSVTLATRQVGATSLSVFCEVYKNSSVEYRTQLLDQLIKSFKDPKEFQRCGSFEALAVLPACVFIESTVGEILGLMVKYANSNDINSLLMTEARASAVSSAVKLFLRLSEEEFEKIIAPMLFDCLFIGLEDYTVTSRGDGGLEVRMASLIALKELIQHVIRVAPKLITPELAQPAACQILSLCLCHNEKFRSIACETFIALLQCGFEPPHADQLRSILSESTQDPSNSLEQFIRVLAVEEYATDVWKSLITSMGGKTLSTASRSRAVLATFLKKAIKDEEIYGRITKSFLLLFESSLEVERLTLPLLNSCSFLISSCLFDGLPLDDRRMMVRHAYDCVKRSSDPIKIGAAASLICDSLRFQDTVKLALGYIVVLLCCRFAPVRMKLAEELNVAMLTFSDYIFETTSDGAGGDLEEDCDQRCEESLALLQETDWRSAPSELKATRNKLCDLMGVQPPTAVKK